MAFFPFPTLQFFEIFVEAIKAVVPKTAIVLKPLGGVPERTGLDPARLTVRTILNGTERQNYPIADMIFSAQELVSKISHDMTLLPGDLIAVGTSVGVGVMKEPVNIVTVAIDGIGELTNEFRL